MNDETKNDTSSNGIGDAWRANEALSRRRFLTLAACLPAVPAALSLLSDEVNAALQSDTARGDTARGDTARGDTARGDTARGDTARGDTAPYNLPPLPYSYAALEPHIDARTMRLHHDRHHKKYVDDLNKAIAKAPSLRSRTPQELIRNLNQVPASIRDTVRNTAGGHVNHSMFWQIMSPRGGAPSGEAGRAINAAFGSFQTFVSRFNEAGLKRFGSGWVWLARDANNRLRIMSTPNQDNPMMREHGGLFPVLGNDVWEHAYYLKYQNRRADYLKAWWNTVNWNAVNARLLAAR